ncbi:MAG: type I-B CRISPR-associated protein Cas7/Cst2/DevR, partial [Bacteroidia bacterium]
WQMSPVAESSEKKGAAKTGLNPTQYIDDDLFGFMDADKKETLTRTSPVRVDALLALTSYKGDLDFGTNYMAKAIGGNPNIFETEIHSGIYRGTILIELDRVGCGEGFKEKTITNEEKAKRVLGLLDAFQMLWSSGRQSRFLADISPKFIAAAYLKAKNPVFLEAVNLTAAGKLDTAKLTSVVSDYERFMSGHVFAAQEGVFEKVEGITSLKEGFAQIQAWVKDYYQVG